MRSLSSMLEERARYSLRICFRDCAPAGCRAMAASAGIVFSPYNYLLDGKIRGGLASIKWAGVVLIFDEAHNLEVRLFWTLPPSSKFPSFNNA